jgi:flagellar basal-body rod modification protein FlgD
MNVTSVASTGQVSGDQLQNNTGLSSLTPNDFINLMVTELQNQDPTQPESNDELLSQMSQIGQLESSDSLQTTLSGLAQQNQIGAASSLIGKSVEGTDSNNNPVTGTVTSVSIASTGVTLGLDSGSNVALTNITNIAPTATPASTSTTTTPATTTTTDATTTPAL